MKRFIGIRHRRKATKEGEARPTTVAIHAQANGEGRVHDLQTETDELDFLMGRFPIEWRKLEDDEEVVWFNKDNAPAGIRPHHCKWREVKKDEDVTGLKPELLIKTADKKVHYLVKVPCAYEGLKPGDVVGMVLGGSGDRFAAALSRRGEEIGSTVWRIPPFALLAFRGTADKDDDHLTLARLVEEHRDSFYLLRRRDREGIRVKEALAIRQEAMKARIGCEQRILQGLVGQIFLSEEGRYPEGLIEDDFDRIKANDSIYQSMLAEESRRDKDLDKAVKALGIWDAIFKDIVGCGPRTTAGIVAPISDIRRFWVAPDSEAMRKLYERSRTLEEQGMLEQDKVHVMHRVTSSITPFQVLQMTRSWQAANGKPAEAQLLTEAIECHRQRHLLRVKAFQKGMAKLKKFCGVHCTEDGKFPRRRTGQVANWNPNARQALYLLGDQFNRRPASHWGKELLKWKLKLREVHPEVVEVEGKKRYTNGHIHKMAIWRTLSKFVEHLFKVWSRIEKEQNGGIQAASGESAAA